jgi:Protein of unknown function (DUF4232)
MRITRRAVAVTAVLAAAGGTGLAVTAASAAPAAPVAARTPAATSAGLEVWVGRDLSQGAAGTLVFPLEFTNITGHAMTIRGYPGVSALNASGKQLGAAAGWDAVYPAKTITIPAGGTVHANLFYSDVLTSTPSNKPATAAILRVYPPNQTTARTTYFSLPVTTKAGVVDLHVTVIRPGLSG